MIMSEAVCERPLACNFLLKSGKQVGPVFLYSGCTSCGWLVATTVSHCALEGLDG